MITVVVSLAFVREVREVAARPERGFRDATEMLRRRFGEDIALDRETCEAIVRKLSRGEHSRGNGKYYFTMGR